MCRYCLLCTTFRCIRDTRFLEYLEPVANLHLLSSISIKVFQFLLIVGEILAQHRMTFLSVKLQDESHQLPFTRKLAQAESGRTPGLHAEERTVTFARATHVSRLPHLFVQMKGAGGGGGGGGGSAGCVKSKQITSKACVTHDETCVGLATLEHRKCTAQHGNML